MSDVKMTNNESRKCAAYRPLLSEFIDGALGADSAWTVQKHLSLCPACAQFARDLQATALLLGALPARSLSTGFDAALQARIAHATAARATRPGSAWRRYFARLRASTLIPMPFGSRRALAGVLGTAAACALVAGAFFTTPLTVGTVTAPSPVHERVSDSALVKACLNQHHSTAVGEPLADPAASMLDAQLDALPTGPAAAPSAGLSDEDASILLSETD